MNRQPVPTTQSLLGAAAHTVKKHTSNIYTKLGVRNRRQAVAKAEEMSFLPPA